MTSTAGSSSFLNSQFSILNSFLDSVQKTVLPNGLTLLFRHQPGGVVAINTWVKAGYFHEPDEVAGMAHLFEHMFFKGSAQFPGAEEIARHVSSLGGSTNAGTIYDSTNYYFVLPSEGFVRGLEIQADAIAHPLFDPDELRKECEVVIEESNRKLDNPPAVATERMFEIAFTQHRMKRWRIGSNDVLRNIKRENLLAFFETLYRPENIIVSVVGDVPAQQALDAMLRTFGQLSVGTLRKERGPSEPPQNEFRYGQGTADIKQSYAVMGWHTTGEGHEDEEALDLLASILGSGKYSRLYRHVVAPDGASTISASNSVFEDVGIFSVRASCDDANLGKVEAGIVREIERLRQFGPTELELELSRNGLESGFVFALEDVLGQAQTLAFYEARGDYRQMARHLEKMRGLTAGDVQRVARTYLDEKNLTLYRYRPHGAAAALREDLLEELRRAAAVELQVPEVRPLPRRRPEPSPANIQRNIQRFVLSNGATLFVLEVKRTPTVSMSVDFRGGRIREDRRSAGLTQLMTRVMRRGTTGRTAEEIDEEIEFLGTQIGIGVDDDYFGFSLDILRRHFRHGVEILADVLLHPTFPADRLEQERHLQLAGIKRSLDSSSERPLQMAFETFFGTHPYAHPQSGYLDSVVSISRDELKRWFEGSVCADECLIVVTGDIDAEEVRVLLEENLGSMPKSRSLHPAVESFTPPAAVREVVEIRDKKQSALVYVFPSVPPAHSDWIPIRLLQDVTSGLAGTFFAELRGKRSLAYTVYAGDSSRELAGAFVAYIATDAVKEEEARIALLEELRRLGEDGIQAADVARARSHMAGSTRIRLQTNSALRNEISQNYLYSLGLDFTERFLERIHAVTLEELRAVAKKYLSSDNYTVAILRGKI
ncbi:MAG TPA: pitrilysin family protein [Thermoanaerobaculia bacterium]|nr:pitrilysin family protein [Thermoanaerobaculia bacterium]